MTWFFLHRGPISAFGYRFLKARSALRPLTNSKMGRFLRYSAQHTLGLFPQNGESVCQFNRRLGRTLRPESSYSRTRWPDSGRTDFDAASASAWDGFWNSGQRRPKLVHISLLVSSSMEPHICRSLLIGASLGTAVEPDATTAVRQCAVSPAPRLKHFWPLRGSEPPQAFASRGTPEPASSCAAKTTAVSKLWKVFGACCTGPQVRTWRSGSAHAPNGPPAGHDRRFWGLERPARTPPPMQLGQARNGSAAAGGIATATCLRQGRAVRPTVQACGPWPAWRACV